MNSGAQQEDNVDTANIISGLLSQKSGSGGISASTNPADPATSMHGDWNSVTESFIQGLMQPLQDPTANKQKPDAIGQILSLFAGS